MQLLNLLKKSATTTSVLSLSVAMASMLTACGDVDGVPAQAEPELRSGSLRAYAGPGAAKSSDVAFIQYTVTACAGSGSTFANTVVVPLNKHMVLPGGIGQFEDAPLDNRSAHLFADHFQVLHAGCYDVVAVPLNADKQPSATCTQAQASGLNVLEAATTETMLIVQCTTVDPGALDVVTVINHEPHITDIIFKKGEEEGSKFVCGFENHVCITAHDEDMDPLDYRLSARIGENVEACKVTKVENETKSDERCFHIVCDQGGRVDLKATVFDMLRNPAKELITFEEHFTNIGDPKSSRAELAFMSYFGGQADCDEPCETEPEPEPEDPDCPCEKKQCGHGTCGN